MTIELAEGVRLSDAAVEAGIKAWRDTFENGARDNSEIVQAIYAAVYEENMARAEECAFQQGANSVVKVFGLQREVMRLSDQMLPPRLELNAQSLMYAALQMEELGEQFEGMVAAIRAMPAPAHRVLLQVARRLKLVGSALGDHAREMREALKDDQSALMGWHHCLTLEQAKPIVDGAMDSAVVTAGFALSCGMPADECYARITYSNISKANPVTGVIDKEADGKWIKGPNYVEPKLDDLLAPLCVIVGTGACVQRG